MKSEELNEQEKKQLIKAGFLYFGEKRSFESLFQTDDEENSLYDEEDDLSNFLELWDVVDDEKKVVYNLWLYEVDAGTMFKVNSTEVFAEIIQFGFECKDNTTRIELENAQIKTIKDYHKTGLEQVSFK
jgi:hypothetical protein